MTHIRNWQPDDVPALVQLRQAVYPLDHQDLERTLDTVRNEMGYPGLDPAHNVFVAESDDRDMLGLGKLVLVLGQQAAVWAYMTVRPDARADDTGQHLLQAIWNRAQARCTEYQGLEAWLQFEIHSQAEWQIQQMEQFGLTIGRYSLEMLRPLQDSPIPPLTVPDGIALKPHRRSQDDHAANAAVTEAFRDHWSSVSLTDEQFVHLFEAGYIQPEVSVIAWAGGEIAGACYNDLGPLRTMRAGYPQGYVDSLSVRRPWRKRGLATAMLVWTLREAAHRGLQAVALGVDAENPTGAKRLYEKVGFYETQRFCIFRRRINGEAAGITGIG